MMKWIMNNKIIAGIIVIALISISVFGIFTYTEMGQDIIDGLDKDESNSSVTTIITDVSTGNIWYATIDMDSPTATQTIFGGDSVPFTLFNTTLQGISPDSIYTLQFVINSVALPEDETTGTPLDMTIDFSGKSGNYYYSYLAGQTTDLYTVTTPITSTIETTSGASTSYTTEPVFARLTSHSGSYPLNSGTASGDTFYIYGDYIDGSVFTANIEYRDTATGGFEYYGLTEATITISVDPDGNMAIIVEDVDVVGVVY